jgi:putative serine protease PepD
VTEEIISCQDYDPGNGTGEVPEGDVHGPRAVGRVDPVPPLQPGEPGDGHGEDGHDADDVGYAPPLPPEDRLWRHPSEVASGRAVAAPARGEPSHRRRTASLVLASGLAGAALALGSVALLGGFDDRVVERQAAGFTADVAQDTAAGPAAIADRTAPSVAALRIDRGGERTDASAVAFRPDGHLLTDGPAVLGADGIEVALQGGWTGTARLVGIDDVTGLAVLHVDTDTEPAAFAAGDLATGAPTVAVGTSLEGGWGTTVSTGVVAGLDRRLEGRDGTTRHGMILVDRPFAPGSAGGALVDGDGDVVGIVSGGQATASGTSYGVATPIDLAHHVAEQLVEDGHARHVWLGLRGTDLDVDAAASLGVAGGALVEDALADGPAHRAGIVPGDVIVAVDDHPTPTMSVLIAALRRHEPGDVVALAIHREGEPHTVRVTLDAKR